MKRKFILTLTNEKKFDSRNYEKDSLVIETSHLTWHPVFSKERKELINLIKIGHLSIQDNFYFHVGDLTADDHKTFNVVQAGERPYEHTDHVHFCLNYEMSRNLVQYDREVYTTLDWFGNLGGLQ